jgi:GTP-binding protein
VERTRLIAHLVDTSDASDRDPVNDFEIIERELAAFSPALAEEPTIVVATKLDATTDRNRLENLRAFAEKRGLEFHAISSATGEGVVELVRAIADALDRIPKPAPASDASEVPYAGAHTSDEPHASFPGEDRPGEVHATEDEAAAPHREKS